MSLKTYQPNPEIRLFNLLVLNRLTHLQTELRSLALTGSVSGCTLPPLPSCPPPSSADEGLCGLFHGIDSKPSEHCGYREEETSKQKGKEP